MAQLTKEQIEAARFAFNKEANKGAGSADCLIAAAPFLQLPWEPLTEEQIRAARTYISTVMHCIVDTGIIFALAKILQVHYDPRLQTVISVLEDDETLIRPGDAPRAAALILAALDGKEK